MTFELLGAASLRQLPTSTESITITNIGADTKFMVGIECTDIEGNLKAVWLADQIDLGATVTIALSELNIAIQEFVLTWEDSCARIRRYTERHAATGNRGFRTLEAIWRGTSGRDEFYSGGGLEL